MHLIHEPLPLVVSLLLLLVVARMLGELMERIHQPSVIGELLAGIILGPSILGLAQVTNDLRAISDLGVILLMVLAGMEISLEGIRNSLTGRNVWIAILGFVIPLFSGFLIGYLFHFDYLLTLFIGLCIAITALPVSVRILMDLGKLDSDIGRKIISAAIFNDVLALLILGVILDININGGDLFHLSFSIGLTLAKIILFIALLVFVYRILKKFKGKLPVFRTKLNKVMSYLKNKESLFAFAIVFVLVFASLAEILGLHFIVGAFFGALLLNNDLLGTENYKDIHKTISGITIGFLAPIFFAYMGLEFSFSSLTHFWLVAAILIASFASKILGGYLGGRLSRMARKESFTLGIGLNARGIMELVIANIALKNNFISVEVFSILVLMGIVTTFLSPILLKWGFNRIENSNTIKK